MKRFLTFACLSLLLTLGLAGFREDPSGCDSTPTADQVTSQKQAQMQTRGTQQVGLPNIVKFTELRRAKRI